MNNELPIMNFLLDFLFPKKCVGCRKIGIYFCDECIQEIKQTDLVCPFCERLSLGGITHPVCKRKYGLDGLWSLGIYEPPLKTAISKLKYRYIREFAEKLVDITLEYWAKYSSYILDQIKKDQGKNWIVTPVPLHWTRQNLRGFNQSAEIAEILASKIGLEYKDTLKRTKKTKPQVRLPAYQRKQNIKGAFSLSPNYQLQPTNYLLIDDVWTTGSTLKECCYILKRGGAKKVWALTLAR